MSFVYSCRLCVSAVAAMYMSFSLMGVPFSLSLVKISAAFSSVLLSSCIIVKACSSFVL